jgi:hypothetical protein
VFSPSFPRKMLQCCDIVVDQKHFLAACCVPREPMNVIVKGRCARRARGEAEAGNLMVARQGVALRDAMQKSRHGSVQQASGYSEAVRAKGRAARLGLSCPRTTPVRRQRTVLSCQRTTG